MTSYFVSNNVALFKLQIRYYIILTKMDAGNGFTKLSAELYQINGAGYCRFKKSYFDQLLVEGLIVFSHETEQGKIFITTNKFKRKYGNEEKSKFGSTNFETLFRT